MIFIGVGFRVRVGAGVSVRVTPGVLSGGIVRIILSGEYCLI